MQLNLKKKKKNEKKNQPKLNIWRKKEGGKPKRGRKELFLMTCVCECVFESSTLAFLVYTRKHAFKSAVIDLSRTFTIAIPFLFMYTIFLLFLVETCLALATKPKPNQKFFPQKFIFSFLNFFYFYFKFFLVNYSFLLLDFFYK